MSILHAMYSKTLSLSLSARVCETKRRRDMRRYTRVYGTSKAGVLRIHWDELKNSTDRLTESETLKHSISVFGEWKYTCAKLILNLQLTYWRVKSENLLAGG